MVRHARGPGDARRRPTCLERCNTFVVKMRERAFNRVSCNTHLKALTLLLTGGKMRTHSSGGSGVLARPQQQAT